MHYYREFIELSIPELPARAVITDNQKSVITAEAHLHSELEMIYVLEGKIAIAFGHERLTLNKGELILINSMLIHATTIPEDTFAKIFVLQFNPSSLYHQPIFSKYRFLLPFINQVDCPYYCFTALSPQPFKEIEELINKIILELTNKEITYDLSVKSYLYRILSLLYRYNILQYKRPDILIENQDLFLKLESIFEYTEINYMENISITTLSEMTHFNYSYFCRLFKKATGKSYIEYLNFVRVAIAEELIRTTPLPMSIILEKTGFSSLSYFYRIFKRLKGISPSTYRKHMTPQL